jgi:putative PIN family toxin of toxin-antitoxin system
VRVFLDTNVLVSAFTARGLCADLYELAAVRHELIIGAPVITELTRILEKKLRVPQATQARISRLLEEFEQVPVAKLPPGIMIKDPADAAVIASAIAGRADVIVTGDKALQDLQQVADIPVISPRKCWLVKVPGLAYLAYLAYLETD